MEMQTVSTETDVQQTHQPSMASKIKREWRARQRRRAYRKAYNPSILDAMMASRRFTSKGASSASWEYRWPALACVADMFSLKGRNFFQAFWDCLRPLRMAFGLPIAKPSKSKKKVKKEIVEVRAQEIQNETVVSIQQTEPEMDLVLKALKEEKEARIAAIKENRTFKDRVKGVFGRSDLDKLDKEFDALEAARLAEINGVHETVKKDQKSKKAKKTQLDAKPGVEWEPDDFFHNTFDFFTRPISFTRKKVKSDEKNSVTSSVTQAKMTAQSAVPETEKHAEISADAENSSEKAQLIEACRERGQESTMELIPDFTRLGNAKRLKEVLNSLIDALRVKTNLTDNEMGEITLMSRIVNAYGS